MERLIECNGTSCGLRRKEPEPVRDSVVPLLRQGGIILEWMLAGVGQGSIFLTVKDGKLVADGYQSPQFVADIVRRALEP